MKGVTIYDVQDRLETAKQLERTRLDNGESRHFVLTGVIKCGECGSALMGRTHHGKHGAYTYYGHSVSSSKHNCKIQRVSADEIERVVLNYLKKSLHNTGYFSRLTSRIDEITKKTCSGTTEDLVRVKAEIKELEQEASNVFRMQAQGDFDQETLTLMSERLATIAKRKSELTKYLAELEHRAEECVDASTSSSYIKEKFVDFENGFRKATSAQKKRLIQKTIKQMALTKDGLALWFYMSETDDLPGRKLKLIRDEAAEGGLSLISGADSNDVDRCLLICRNGASGEIRTPDHLVRSQVLYPTELRTRMRNSTRVCYFEWRAVTTV